MIGLDTNVLVRYIMQDDAKQSPKASALIESLYADHPGFISLISVVELYWVLTSCHEFTGPQVKSALEALLRVKLIVVDRSDQFLHALRVFDASKADFADCLVELTASGAGCTETRTFDAGAAKHGGMTLIR
ncbi:type II toxin-antitoxin system VapC family toxin [Limnohabitans sp.]|uniref:PIN domain-containing protein n=1 Tax=Limnohabitans sp. TaxID=1907725 RepID=UPI00286F42E6|nr:type II toxin-antitoxin system VapC family toxin [Limnohabitans sp.]